jgi:hypothetical protein
MLPAENGGSDATQDALNSAPLTGTFCREFLLTNQNPDGGWGYHPTSPSGVEATAWALLGLMSGGRVWLPSQPCDRACDWLLHAQLGDGAWPAFPGQPQGCWTTSLASWALQAHGGSVQAVERGLHWVLNAWPAEGTLWWRLRQAVGRSAVVRQDSSLRGWSWTPGTASWVEPTAYALLLLRNLPAEMLTSQMKKRRRLAERMLYNRMCPSGGWNSGNPLVYGVAGVPRVGPTSWALLALIDHAERAENRISLDWLEQTFGEIRGAASLALAHRCLTAYGRQAPPLAPMLGSLYARNRFFENTLAVAWAALALSVNENRSSETSSGALTS